MQDAHHQVLHDHALILIDIPPGGRRELLARPQPTLRNRLVTRQHR
jgi:hypothetical protein